MRAGCRKRTRGRRTRTATRSTRRRLPLFTEADAFRALSQLQPFGFDRPIDVVPGVHGEVRQRGASARVRVRRHDAERQRRILFGGDLGRYDRPGVAGSRRPSATPTSCSANRPTATASTRPTTEARGSRRSSSETIAARRQADHSVLCHRPRRRSAVLDRAPRAAKAGFPKLPVFVDSPDGDRGLAFLPSPASTSSIPRCGRRGSGSARSARAGSRPSRRRSSRRSWWRPGRRRSCISSSGMATGGRVLHHLEAALPDRRNTCSSSATRRRHAGPQARGWRRRGEDPRPARAGGRAHREDRLDVGPCRPERDPAVARRIFQRRPASPTWSTASPRRWTALKAHHRSSGSAGASIHRARRAVEMP